MSSDLLARLRVLTEADFASIGVGRKPDKTVLPNGGVPHAISCANPSMASNIETAVNEEVSNVHGTRAPTVLTKKGTLSCDLYVRGVGSAAFADDHVHDIYESGFGLSVEANTGATQGHDIAAVLSDSDAGGDVDTITVAEFGGGKLGGVGAGLCVYFEDVPYVTFITHIEVAALADDVITVSPPLPLTVIGALTVWGGLTYAVGSDFASNTSLYAQLEKVDYTNEMFGGRLSKFRVPLETGKAAISSAEIMFADFDPDIALGSPTLGASPTPVGAWLKFINGQALIDGVCTAIRTAEWDVDFAPKMVPAPCNSLALAEWEMGKPRVTCSVTLSQYDDGVKWGQFNSESSYGVLCALGLGDSSPGNVVAFYCPKMHASEAPIPSAVDDLTSLPLSLEGNGFYDGDTAGDTLAGSFFRMFAVGSTVAD